MNLRNYKKVKLLDLVDIERAKKKKFIRKGILLSKYRQVKDKYFT